MTISAADILVVEDEDKIADVLVDYLHAQGHRTHRLARGDEVEAWVRSHPVDLVLLDLMLPGRSGLEVCKALRTFSAAAIIMLTARVAAVLRRTRRDPAAAAVPGTTGLALDEQGWRATLDGQPLELTAVEFKLLSVLFRQPGRIYSRDQLMDAMYRDERVVADRTVDSHVKKLRRKLAEVAPQREFIHSVYGAGYYFEERA